MPASKALPPFKSTSNAAALVKGWPAETAPFGPATVGRSAARGNSAVGPAVTNAAVNAATAMRRRTRAIVSMTAEMIAQADRPNRARHHMGGDRPLAAARHAEGPDARRVVRAAGPDVIAHIPDRAVVRGIDGRLRVVLPAHGVLRRLALDEHRLAERETPGGIVGEAPGEALAREVRRPAERIADPDIAGAVDGWTRHPPERS